MTGLACKCDKHRPDVPHAMDAGHTHMFARTAKSCQPSLERPRTVTLCPRTTDIYPPIVPPDHLYCDEPESSVCYGNTCIELNLGPVCQLRYVIDPRTSDVYPPRVPPELDSVIAPGIATGVLHAVTALDSQSPTCLIRFRSVPSGNTHTCTPCHLLGSMVLPMGVLVQPCHVLDFIVFPRGILVPLRPL